MATLTAQVLSSDGLDPTYSPADVAGDEFDNASLKNPFVHVKNGDAAGITVTPVITQLVDGQSVTPKNISIPAGESRFIGPFPRAAYGTTLTLTYSAVANVTVAVLQLES